MGEEERKELPVLRMQVVLSEACGSDLPAECPAEVTGPNARCEIEVCSDWASVSGDIVVIVGGELAGLGARLRWIAGRLADAAPGTVAIIGNVYAVRMDSEWVAACAYWADRRSGSGGSGQLVSEAVLAQWPTKSQRLMQSFRQLDSLPQLWPRILIVGETGTGKTCLAEVIHRCLPQTRNGRLVVVSPATACVDTASSEIFGHRRGSFTGAVRDREGRCSRAKEGTLLLDDVEVYPPHVQPILLRFVDEGFFQKVGEVTEQKADCVVIATASTKLEELVREGKFRRDLYERLSGTVLFLPPLRRRPEDIPHYAALFLRKQFGLDDDAVQRLLGDEVVERLLAYEWPGNVRELEHVLRHLYRRVGGKKRAKRKHVEAAIDAVRVKGYRKKEDDDLRKLDEYPIEHDLATNIVRTHVVKAALCATRGNVSKASKWLNVSRSYLYAVIAQQGIDLDELRSESFGGGSHT